MPASGTRLASKRRALCILAVGSALLLAVPAGVSARGGTSARHAAPNAVAATILSHIAIGAKAEPNGQAQKSKNSPVFGQISVSKSGAHGNASASASSSTTIASSHGVATVHARGSLDAAARCSTTSCAGDGPTAVVSAHGDASIVVSIGASGTMPYLLIGTMSASGNSQAPCAAVSVGLTGDDEAQHFRVSAPTTDDPGCDNTLVPRTVALLSHGILHASGDVTFEITADTSFIDPGSRRTDRLAADWDLTLKLGPTCDISASDDPGYDPSVGATIAGTSADEVICGGDGPDTITGGGGTDKVYGGGGGDTLSARGTLSGDNGGDTLCGSNHADIIDGGGSTDLIDGGPGPDTIDGGRGDDFITSDGVGAFCSDIPSGPAAVNHIQGGSGNDSITTFGGDDRVDGGAGDDFINGDSGSEHLSGGSGRDKLLGHGGKDVLIGGTGRDVLDGGSANDTIKAQDGARDTVRCGSGGGDFAALDHLDVASHCEATTVLH